MSRDESRLELSCTGTEYWPRGQEQRIFGLKTKTALRAPCGRPATAACNSRCICTSGTPWFRATPARSYLLHRGPSDRCGRRRPPTRTPRVSGAPGLVRHNGLEPEPRAGRVSVDPGAKTRQKTPRTFRGWAVLQGMEGAARPGWAATTYPRLQRGSVAREQRDARAGTACHSCCGLPRQGAAKRAVWRLARAPRVSAAAAQPRCAPPLSYARRPVWAPLARGEPRGPQDGGTLLLFWRQQHVSLLAPTAADASLAAGDRLLRRVPLWLRCARAASQSLRSAVADAWQYVNLSIRRHRQ